jgi:hypothetical protein
MSSKPQMPKMVPVNLPSSPATAPAEFSKQIDLKVMREKKFFIATPCYGGALMEPYYKSILRLVFFCDKNAVPLQFGTIANESLVTRARNTLVAFFMKSDCTHLVFIDADIEFKVEDFIRLYAADKDVVVGAYPKKGLSWEQIRNQVLKNPTCNAEDIHAAGSEYAINFLFSDMEKKMIAVEEGLIKLKDAGTGFMMIKRECIEKMMKAHPELQYRNDLNVDKSIDEFSFSLFDTMIDEDSRRYLSEDYTFCRRWQRMGGDVWLDPSISLNHYGTTKFPGNPMLIFNRVN